MTDIWAPALPWWTPSGELSTRSLKAYYSGKPHPQMTDTDYDAMRREQKLVSHDWRRAPITSRDGRATEGYPHDVQLSRIGKPVYCFGVHYPGFHDDTYGVLPTQWLT